jgi:hypothetical protein
VVDRWLEEFEKRAEELVNRAPPDRFAVSSTARQMRRYIHWWWSHDFLQSQEPPATWTPPQSIIDATKRVIARLEEYDG